MDSVRLQKIQTSVKIVPILTQAEKKDWLELMGFMTDRQLLELERILSEVNIPKALPPKPIPPAATVPKLPPIPPKPSYQQPPFSHILNMPKGGFASLPQQNLLKDKKKPDSPFLAKLKGIFAEKELPAAHMEELPPPGLKKVPPKPPVPLKSVKLAEKQKTAAKHEKTQSDKVRDSVLEALKRQKDKKENLTINVFVNDEKAKQSIPGLPEVNREEIKQEQAAPKLSPSSGQPPAQSSGQPPAQAPISIQTQPAHIQNIIFSDMSKAQAEAQKPIYTELQKAVTRAGAMSGSVTLGKNFSELPPELPITAALEEMASNPKSANQPKPVNPVEFIARKPGFKAFIEDRPGDNIRLQNLSDVKNLAAEDLELHATGTFLRSLQKLIVQFGLHQVVVNLEDSPLYKTYVQTGSEWLKNGFKAGDQPGLLNLKDFERFADLLIVMNTQG